MSDRELSRLGRHVAEQQDAELAATEPSAGTRRLLAEYAGRRAAPESRRRAARSGLRLTLAALLVLGVFAVKELVFWRPPLSFTVGHAGQPGVLRDWEEAPDDARLPIRFSDGSLVELEPGARARVVAVGRAGAEIVLESGRAHVSVTKVPFRVPGESPWRFELGPFSVAVKGTRFDLAWDPRRDEFALDLLEGSVHIDACGGDRSEPITAGQGVRASCSGKRWMTVSLADVRGETGMSSKPETPPATGATSPTGATPAAGSIPPAPNTPGDVPASHAQLEPAPAASEQGGFEPPPRARPRAVGAARDTPAQVARGTRRAARASWPELARAGHFGAAYEVALELGFEAECERAPAEELALLADTARLNGDRERARIAYGAARRRHPGSASAARAAFALGRLAADVGADDAAGWFERYLDEQPTGPLAPAAHDWLFELALRSERPERRREAARRYLGQHPDGAHAQDARRILHAPR